MTDQVEMLLDLFPGKDFLLPCTSMAGHKSNSFTRYIFNSNLYRVHNFSST